MNIKIIACLLALLLPPTIQAQVHLGKSISEIKAMHPGKVFTSGTTSTGATTYSTDYELGEFTYYMDNTTGRCNFCMMTPKNAAALKTQTDIYNHSKKYTLVAPRLWKTKTEDGAVLTINLVYDSDPRVSYFVYKTPG